MEDKEKQAKAAALSVSPEDLMTKEEFLKQAKEFMAESQAKLTEAMSKVQISNTAENQKKAFEAKQAASLGEWMVAYGKGDVRSMKKVTQDFIADTGTPGYAGNLVHPVFEEMVYRFTARWTPIYNGSRKITLRRGEGNTFNTQDLITDVTAAWLGEGGVKPVTRMNIGRKTVTLDKLAGIVIMTDEMRADAFLDFPSLIAERMARVMGIRIEAALLIGNGLNTDGLFNTAGVTFVNIGNALTDFTYDDLLRGKVAYLKVADAFSPEARAYISPDTYGNILTAKDQYGAYLIPNTNPSAVSPTGTTPAFLGQIPYEVATQIPTTGLTAGDAVGLYTDLSQHSLVVEKEGMEVLYSQHGSVTFEDDGEQEVVANAYQEDLTLGRFVRRIAGLVVNPSGVVVFRLGNESS